MPKYLPAGLTQYVLNNFSKKSAPHRVTQDDVSTPLQRLEVEKITGHQSVRGRGGVIAVMYETHWTGLSGPSWQREIDLQLFRHEIFALLGGHPEMVLHNGNFLGAMASDSLPGFGRVPRAESSAAKAPRCFPTDPSFAARAATVCGGLGRSALARLRMGYIWSAFWTTRG